MNLNNSSIPNSQNPDPEHEEFTYSGLDRLIHERARLGILTALNRHSEGLMFVDLKRLCSLTDGNLSRHLAILQKAGLIEIWKSSVDKKSQTLCKISTSGSQKFAQYLSVLQQVLSDNTSATT